MVVKIIKAAVVFIWVLLFGLKAFSQPLTISGNIRDINTYQEIRGVNIFIKGTNIGTSSKYSGSFSLSIPLTHGELIVVFKHIAYEKQEIPLDSLKTIKYVYLQPRVIPLQGVEIEEKGIRELEIAKDLPQTISIIEARSFEIRGYVDAGDLLRTDHSVQIDEELSGEKTVSIRGGNSDEVIVLFNGIKMNNNFDNVFDLSLIDLEDVERFEIIKGSNTALYGPEAFSGVINIVPKLEQDYTIRFQQRLGTYRSGNFGLHLYKRFNRLLSSYSYKRGGLRRTFVDVPEDQARLKNSSIHHTGNLSYSLSENADGSPANAIGLMWIYSSLDFDNQRDVESLNNFNNLFSLKYSGDIATIKDVEFSVSYKNLEEEQFLASEKGALNRDIGDQAFYINTEKRFKIGRNDFLLAYQYQNSKLDLVDDRTNFDEQPIGVESSDIRRQHHGIVAITKIRGATESDFLQNFDLDVSLRHDRVRDQQFNTKLRSDTQGEGEGSTGFFNKNSWQQTTVKFSINVTGYRNDLFLNAFLNFGSNIKFPTLFQQISSPSSISERAAQPNLNPEKNRSFEVGTVVTKDIREHATLYGWQFSASYFLNNYENKFRTFITPGIPVPFYDNVQDARISGFETKSSVFLFRKKVTLDFGLSIYNISEKAAFPFKSDYKRTMNFTIDHAGYSFQIYWFKEGEQVAWVRRFQSVQDLPESPNFTENFAQVVLPDYTNLDVHLSKTFEIGNFEIFLNVSGRNLLNDDDVELQGLSIRDRRFYVTFGAQY
jgi:outer membrane receptor protein involved in Fe transport